jgi:hypothetical protein
MFKDIMENLYKKKLKWLLFALLIYGSGGIMAQNIQLKGVVKDAFSNEPLEFVNVVVYNTTMGTTTDSLGYFRINLPNEGFAQLQLSFLGYKSLITEEFMLSFKRSDFIEILLEPTSTSLSEVTVKPSPFIRKLESPVSLRRIGIDQIEKSAGANRDISKVIQSFAGVASSVSYRNDLIVRGGGPSENRFYLDGIEIPTINHFTTQGASGGPVGILNVDFIREVDFYSSAFPVNRGNAMSSVLDFKQMDGSRDKVNVKGVLGASEIAASVSAPLSEKTSMLASARRSYLQFLFKALDLPFLPTFNDFQFKTKTRINTKNEISFIGVGAIDQFDLNYDASNTLENKYILSYIPDNDQWSYAVGVNYKHFFNKSYLTVVASRNMLDNKAIKYRDNIETADNLIYDYHSQEAENKFRTEINSKLGNVELYGGLSFETASYYNSTFTYEYVNGASQVVTYDSSLDFFKYAAFASASFSSLNNRLGLSMGMRVNANSYSDKMNNPLNQFSPRLSASYRLYEQLALNFSIAKYYQTPAYTTMGYRNSDGDLLNEKNGLKYIYSNHYVLGIDFLPNDYTKISVEGFYKKYGDYPFSVSDSVSLASKGSDYGVVGDEEVTSTSKGRAFGYELMFRQRSPKGTSMIAAYTFVRSEFTDIDNNYVPSSWDNKHLFTITYSKVLRRDWDVGFKWRFIGGAPYTPVDDETTRLKTAWDISGKEYLDYGQFNQKRLENFHQLDLRIDKKYHFNKWSLSVYIDIQNAYNYKIKDPVKYVVDLDDTGSAIIENPDAPLSEQRYQFSKIYTESGTVLPTLGVIIEL